MSYVRCALFGLLLAIPAGSLHADVWDDAYDASTGTRFIPIELILGAAWNGNRSITHPSGTFRQTVGGSTWEGPEKWMHPVTGRSLTVYYRSRGGRNAASQVFAVRDDQTAIGRVGDSRFGIDGCDQEGKYPLGSWKQGETRTFRYTCWYDKKPKNKIATITIKNIDFDCGGARHCLSIEWSLRNEGGKSEIDRMIYTFAPGQSIVAEQRPSGKK
jgi:hypothetical protein